MKKENALYLGVIIIVFIVFGFLFVYMNAPKKQVLDNYEEPLVTTAYKVVEITTPKETDKEPIVTTQAKPFTGTKPVVTTTAPIEYEMPATSRTKPSTSDLVIGDGGEIVDGMGQGNKLGN